MCRRAANSTCLVDKQEPGYSSKLARLEVLLGARPEAEIDESVKAERETEVARAARSEKVAAAGGQLVSAAFSFLGEMIPRQPEYEPARESLRRHGQPPSA